MKLNVTNHPYYCSKSSYYVGGSDNFGRSEYDSWSDFKEEWLGIGDDSLGIDSDLNYCVRFDITQNEDSGAKDLWLFFLLQRKGIFSPVQVRNIKDSDMPEIEKFLKRQWKYIKKMWKEFSNVD